MDAMDDTEFDRALIAKAFTLAADRGWKAVSVTVAARAADLPLDRARARFPGRSAILMRFGRIADQAALAHASSEGDNRDRLFDLVMRRIDVLQAHRAGVLALREYLPLRPGLTMMLGLATASSMAWLLEAAGVPAGGVRGNLRVQGLVAVWLYTLRAWQSDESEDLSATMAALDKGLDRAVQAEPWLRFGRAADPLDDDPLGDTPMADVPMADVAMSDMPATDVMSDMAMDDLPMADVSMTEPLDLDLDLPDLPEEMPPVPPPPEPPSSPPI